MNEAALKQLGKVQDELDTLRGILADDDAENQRISMLVSGTTDLHIRNPAQFERMKPYADENKPPFTAESWVMLMRLGSDPRLTYDEIERFNSGLTNPMTPWDGLKVGG